MATAVAAPRVRTLNDAELKKHLHRLRRVDNWRNIAGICRTYLLLIVAIAAAVAFDQWRVGQGMNWAWDVPVFAIAITLVGAGQHQLTALGHEASHHVLLRNRLANELVSDWLCMFPVFTSTHHYRLQHLAHHQFVNDPERDPNFGQLQVNGFWQDFPMTKARFWREFFAQFMPWYLMNYLRATAAYNALGDDKNPYHKNSGPHAKRAMRIGVVYLFTLMGTLIALVRYGDPLLLMIVPAAMGVGMFIAFLLMPGSWFRQFRVHASYSIRALSIMRVTYFSLFFYAVGILSMMFGPKALIFAGLLWILPLFTSFAFFMEMRQLVQHSNGDRGWLTNTRVFLMGVLVRDSVLPYGQDYHLPHHLYASVPHYNLKELHEILMEYPEYRDQALVVANAVLKHGHDYPTIVDMLGPDYAPAARHAAHVDNTVLDGVEVDERDAIMEAARVSARDS